MLGCASLGNTEIVLVTWLRLFAAADLTPVASASSVVSHEDAFGPTVDRQLGSHRVGLMTDDDSLAK